MFTVWNVPHYMTSYNGHLGCYQLNFVSYVDRPEFLNHYFFYFSQAKVLVYEVSNGGPSCIRIHESHTNLFDCMQSD